MEKRDRERGESVAELSGVTKRYGSVVALDAFDLAVRHGEVLAVLGPNGAGKTTAINLLLGLTRPASGRVRLFGGPPSDASTRRRVGALLQVAHLPDTLTVREQLELFASYYPAPLPPGTALAAAASGTWSASSSRAAAPWSSRRTTSRRPTPWRTGSW